VVNAYYIGTEMYLNATAAGVCGTRTTLSDNLDPQSTYTFTEEFLGYDNAQFTLANATISSVPGYTLLMNASASGHASCSFELFKASPTQLPLVPSSPATSTPTAETIPSFVQPFITTWYPDSTCNSSYPTCCCLLGATNITNNLEETSAFLISGGPSPGCGIGPVGPESDDFPWPTAANTPNVVSDLLDAGDDYTITLTGSSQATYVLTFTDMSQSQCSMRFTTAAAGGTTVPPSTSSSGSTTVPPSSTGKSGSASRVSIPSALILLAAFNMLWLWL